MQKFKVLELPTGIESGSSSSGLFLNSWYPDKFQDEKSNLHCWLSPVTDTWRGFGWNFVLKKKSLPGSLCSTVWMFLKGRAGSPHSPVCVNKQEHLLKQIPVSTTFLRLSKAANGGTSGSHGMYFPDALGICHSALHKERSHLFPF